MPGSVIFLAIMAIWAAYLLQHWIRRRDHLATARQVDRFSEAMRVLERRATAAPAAAGTSRAYLVSPARESRPEVVVKPALPQSTPTTTARAAEPLRGPAREEARRRRRARGGVRPTKTFRALNGLSGRRLRGLSLLACLLAVPATVTLAVMHRLPWYAVAAAGGAVLLDLLLLRLVARRSRRVRVVDAERLRRHQHLGATRPAASRRASTGSADGAAATGAAAPKPAAREVAGAEQIGWQPVPVPPPTYTLKAKAHPVAGPPRPRADADLEDTQEMAVATDDLDDLLDADEVDELLERRSAIGS